MTFEKCVSSLVEGTVVSYKEFDLDRHERKRLGFEALNVIVQRVFQADEELARDTLIEYYGDQLDDIDYLQLSRMNCPRVVLQLGLNEDNEMNIKIVVLNRDYYDMGLQVVEITDLVSTQFEEPNYMMAQREWT